ncbi:MAG: serine/threonine-protein phosphatase [Lachnospiraceae bacterium]|nr:serine/threonine-protein phosphatase [Lachnospiraceae bacterium]
MMKNFMTAYHTDVGIKKKTNQDSLLLKGIANDTEEILLAVLCDGMGGMVKGELASATVVRAFSEWFEKTYTKKGSLWSNDEIKGQWQALLEKVNELLINHGQDVQIQLGTTVTALLLSSDGKYLVGHVGDTRIYHINRELTQITEDHTFIAREIRRGNMTPEQAAKDSRRNVLLQCIGVNKFFEPQYISGTFKKSEGVLLCSDGFRHEVTEAELYAELQNTSDEQEMKRKLVKLVELNKQRQETDNITAILIKLI